MAASGQRSLCVSGRMVLEEEALLEVRWVSRACSEMLCLLAALYLPHPFISGWWSRSGFFLAHLKQQFGLCRAFTSEEFASMLVRVEV